MKMNAVLLAACFLAGCGVFKKKKTVSTTESNPQVTELQSLYNDRLEALQSEADQPTGWPSVTDCDATLWAGEAVAAGDNRVRLDLAEWEPGEIHRHPEAFGECYPSGSAATVSRDMLMGYIAGEFAAGNLAALQRLADYGQVHHWVMGQGVLSDTFFTPEGAGRLERAIKKLSNGQDSRIDAVIPPVCTVQTIDYARHIQVIGTLLDASIDGKTDEMCVTALQAYVNASPNDALFAAALGVYTGNLGEAITLLLNPAYQPPTYVRGAPTYALVHWLYAAKTVLSRFQ